MRKCDILKILSKAEAARVIDRHQAQITRMPDIVPMEHQPLLMNACKKRVKQCNDALERLKNAAKR